MLTEGADNRRRQALELDLGPLVPILNDERVHDVLGNADGSVWVDRAGSGMAKTSVSIPGHQVEGLLKTIAAAEQAQLGPSHPSLQAEVRWPAANLRIQGLLPPVVTAPVFAIRKPGKLVLPLDQYATAGVLPDQSPSLGYSPDGSSWARRWRESNGARAPRLIERIRHAVRARANVVISGGTGSGKTTFANSLLRELAASADRIFIVEDTRELRCEAENQVNVRINHRRGAEYTYQHAIVDALRLRPDRIIIGEVRDRAALDLLKAWNTGHPGGLATVHANDPAGALERLCQLTEEVVQVAPRRFIAETVNVVLHLDRDGTHPAGRRLTAAALVDGLNPDGTWRLTPL